MEFDTTGCGTALVCLLPHPLTQPRNLDPASQPRAPCVNRDYGKACKARRPPYCFLMQNTEVGIAGLLGLASSQTGKRWSMPCVSHTDSLSGTDADDWSRLLCFKITYVPGKVHEQPSDTD